MTPSRSEREVVLHKELSKNYDVRLDPEFAKLYQRHWNQVLLSAIPPGAAAVLDCGCGTGVLLQDLVGRFTRVAGIDVSPDMLARVPPEIARGCELAQCELEKIAFPEKSFDVVFCRSILHHVGDIDGALARIHDLLKPGGTLILSEPCADSWLLKIPRWYWSRFSVRFDKDHHALSTHWIKECLARHGMKVSVVRKFGFVAFPLCGLSDILPLMRYMPFSCALTRMLIGFDACCARVPVVNWQSWHMVIRAERVNGRL